MVEPLVPAAIRILHADRYFAGGNWHHPAATHSIEVVSPDSETVVARIAEAREAEVDHAVAAAVHHNLLLAHSAAAERLRRLVPNAFVGIALNMSFIYPAVDTPLSRRAAQLAFDQLVMSFLEPLRSGRYPESIVGFSERWVVGAGIVESGDLEQIAGSLDFLSINEYHPRYVVDPEDLAAARLAGFSGGSPSPFAVGLPYLDVEPYGVPHSAGGWMIVPRGLTDLLVEVGELVPGLPLYISENGTTAADYPDQNGDVIDDARVAYLDSHIAAALDAIDAGVNLRGYFLWSFLDNFEWAEGYSQRFGIVYVDYPTRQRTPKRSFGWYRDRIARGPSAALLTEGA